MHNEAYYTYSFEDRIKNRQRYIYISPKDKMLFPFKINLLYSRRYFYNHPIIFLILKLLIGLIFFSLPILIFCLILKNALDYRKYEHFLTATLPLKISVTVILIYVFSLILYRINSMCSSNK